jgi:protein-S-isoprenylcysteine O-methyltransferase Ste14
MFASGIISILLELTPMGEYLFGAEGGIFPVWANYIFVVVFTSIVWLVATFMTQPESKEVLRSFYRKIQPGGPGWRKVVNEAITDNDNIVNKNEKWSVPAGISAMLLGCALIYSCMFATGYWIYGETQKATILTVIAVISAFVLIKVWNKMKKNIL